MLLGTTENSKTEYGKSYFSASAINARLAANAFLQIHPGNCTMQLRYTNRFLDAVVAYALQYGYTRRTVVETGLSTSTLTKYVNDAIEQKYLNRRWHGARTIALYTQKFFHGKKYCLCINVENISLMEMILCTGDKKEREGFDYFVQHMQVKPGACAD